MTRNDNKNDWRMTGWYDLKLPLLGHTYVTGQMLANNIKWLIIYNHWKQKGFHSIGDNEEVNPTKKAKNCKILSQEWFRDKIFLDHLVSENKHNTANQ